MKESAVSATVTFSRPRAVLGAQGSTWRMRAALTSWRNDTRPTSRPPSTIGMWRKLRFNISSRAWVMPSAGERVRGDRVIHDSARAATGWAPAASAARASRSVTMPTTLPSSTITVEPTPRPRMAAAISASEADGAAVNGSAVMTSPRRSSLMAPFGPTPHAALRQGRARAGGIASPRPWTGGNGLPLPAGIDLARNRAPCTS